MARTQAADYEERREAIVDKAAALFASKGFLGTSMSELAQACATSKSLLYHYYTSKEDLLNAVMLSHIDQLLADVNALIARNLEPKAALSALIHAFMTHYVGAADRQKVLLNELDNLPEPERRAVISKQRKIVQEAQTIIARIYTADTDAETRVRTMLVFGMINWTHTWFDKEGPLSADRLAEMVVDLALGAAPGH
jgi:AcrR family transcriptional regulator